MKIRALVIGIIPALVLSCGGLNKKMSGSEPLSQASTEVVTQEPEQAPIVEKREKLVEEPGIKLSPSKYFVIIGSFRSLENAKTLVGEAAGKGFVPVILKSETGYYRVSILATDDESAARSEIYRIKYMYPEHADTWLLIRLS